MKKFNLLLLGLCLSVLAVHAAVPSRIVYQGRLSKSGVGAAGRHTITVQFIDAEGRNLSQSQTFTVDVPTTGDFSLEIDQIPPDADWINGLPKMRVIVGGETLTPDQAFSASPYALVARNIENMDTEKVKLASTNSLPGSGLLSSWQSPEDPSRINSKSILGPIEMTTNHGAEHGLIGKDKIPAGTLSPAQTHGTAMVLASSMTQTIQPTQPVVPLIVKGQPNTNSSLNMIEVWDNAALPEKRFHINGYGNTFFNGNVGIGTETSDQKLRVDGNNQVGLWVKQKGDHHFGLVAGLATAGDGSQSGPRLGFYKGDVKAWAIGISPGLATHSLAIWENCLDDCVGQERFTISEGGNVGIGISAPTVKLEVAGGDLKVSGSINAASISSAEMKTTGRYIDKTGMVMPVGTVLPFAGILIPPGWLWCDGREYTATKETNPEYLDLLQAVGATYGGNGATTFKVPDLRRRVPVGAGGTATTPMPNTLGAMGGEESYSLSIAQMPAHAHGVPNLTQLLDGHQGSPPGSSLKNDGFIGKEQTDSKGGSAPINNMQPSIVLNYIIKY